MAIAYHFGKRSRALREVYLLGALWIRALLAIRFVLWLTRFTYGASRKKDSERRLAQEGEMRLNTIRPIDSVIEDSANCGFDLNPQGLVG